MVTGRPYKEAISKEEALEEIQKCTGAQFDPYLAKTFVQICKKNRI